MTDRKLRMLWVLLAGIMGSTVAQAKMPAALICDSGVGAIHFGAGDLNLLSRWSLHPFPSLGRVPEYRNAALADVKQKSGALWNASGTGTGMYNPSWTLTTLKAMSLDEKIAFWRWVMQSATDRGIHLYVFTWNIFVYGTEPSGYGITDSPSNATAKADLTSKRTDQS